MFSQLFTYPTYPTSNGIIAHTFENSRLFSSETEEKVVVEGICFIRGQNGVDYFFKFLDAGISIELIKRIKSRIEALIWVVAYDLLRLFVFPMLLALDIKQNVP